MLTFLGTVTSQSSAWPNPFLKGEKMKTDFKLNKSEQCAICPESFGESRRAIFFGDGSEMALICKTCGEARDKIKFGKKKIDENGIEYIEVLKQ